MLAATELTSAIATKCRYYYVSVLTSCLARSSADEVGDIDPVQLSRESEVLTDVSSKVPWSFQSAHLFIDLQKVEIWTLTVGSEMSVTD